MEDNVLKLIKLIICAIYETFFFFFCVNIINYVTKIGSINFDAI